ncbi:MAG: hypothetical protein ACREI7_01595, partial [Myxococcota bacterium]
TRTPRHSQLRALRRRRRSDRERPRSAPERPDVLLLREDAPGFNVEFGWGGRKVDDAHWEVATYDRMSTWGHQPAKSRS